MKRYNLDAMLSFEPYEVTQARLALANCPRRHWLLRLRLWWAMRRLRRYYDWIGKDPL